MPYVNTGWATYQLLEEYYLDNGQATGVTKPNQVGDPDYIPPVYNPALCTLQPPTPTATSNGTVPCGTAVVSQNTLEVVTVHAAPDSGNYQIYYDFGTFPVKAEVYYINNSNQEILLYTTNTFVTGNNILFVPVSTAVSGNFFYVRLTATNANAIWNYTIYCPTVATPVPTPTPTVSPTPTPTPSPTPAPTAPPIAGLRWLTGSMVLPNANTPYLPDNVGWSNNGFISNQTTDLYRGVAPLRLLAGNVESIFEFFYESNSPHSDVNDGIVLAICEVSGGGAGRAFGFSNGGNCGQGGALVQINTPNGGSNNFRFPSCNVATVNYNGFDFNVGYIDTAHLNSPYPKTKFKFRLINNTFELYKNDLFVGVVPYDNTVNYNQILFANYNQSSPFTTGAIQILQISGNFA